MDDTNEFSPDLIVLSDENGEEHEFELIDTLELDDTTYYALIPTFHVDDIEADGDLVVLKSEIDEESNEEFFTPIEDEEEFEKVLGLFTERLEDYYEIEEGEDEEE